MKHQQTILATLSVLFTLTLSAADWPQWRGPDRTDISKETGLLKSWPEGGPKQIWRFENAGSAYSGPAIVKGKLYTLGTRDGGEILLVLDANTGKELWTAKLGGVLENRWGDGPRGTPTVDGDRVYALSGPGNLVCVSATDGKVLWQTNLTDLGGNVPGWGYCESVLVDGNQVVCTPGGAQGTIAAFDKATGKQNWQTTEFTDGAHYSSIMAAEINGTPQYVQLVEKNFVGVSPKDGKVLWQADFPKGRTAVIPTPIIEGNRVYVTAGYGAGCKQVAIRPENKVTTLYENSVMKNHHGGVILVGDHVYGHSDGYAWVCQNFKTGEEVWANRDFKKGAVGYADGMLYCLEEGSGTVALVEATPKGWNEKGRFKLEPQSKIRSSSGRIWTHPVICNGKLYLRDQDLIYCYDVKGS